MTKPPLGFVPEPLLLPLSAVLPSRKTPEGLATSRKFKQIIASIEAHPDFRHTVLTSQLERCGEVVLSEQLGQPAKTKAHGLGCFTSRQPSILQGLVKHLHVGRREPLGRT